MSRPSRYINILKHRQSKIIKETPTLCIEYLDASLILVPAAKLYLHAYFTYTKSYLSILLRS